MEPFLGQITAFAGGSTPSGWLPCDGALLPIRTYSALFALIGTRFGGDGRTTFALPDLRGLTPVGGDPAQVGMTGGSSTVTLTATQIARHGHLLTATSAQPSQRIPADPAGKVFGTASPPANAIFGTPASPVALSDRNVVAGHGGQSHSNMQPFLAVTFLIAVQGIFPSRS